MKLIGGRKGISIKEMPRKLQNSFLENNEIEFDALREIIPEGLFNEAASKILNQGGSSAKRLGGQVARPAGKLQLIGETAANIVPKTIAAGVANLPKHEIGMLPSSLIRSIKLGGKGLDVVEGTAKKGFEYTSKFIQNSPVGLPTKILSEDN